MSNPRGPFDPTRFTVGRLDPIFGHPSITSLMLAGAGIDPASRTRKRQPVSQAGPLGQSGPHHSILPLPMTERGRRMKKLIPSICFCFVLSFGYSQTESDGPFGITKGLSFLNGVPIFDLDNRGLKGVQELEISVPRPHPDFIRYLVKGTAETGVCSITAYTGETRDSGLGLKTKAKHKMLSNDISSRYGDPVLIQDTWKEDHQRYLDYSRRDMDNGSFASARRNIKRAGQIIDNYLGYLRDGGMLSTVWNNEKDEPGLLRRRGMFSISIETEALSSSRSRIKLTVFFDNSKECYELDRAVQLDAF